MTKSKKKILIIVATHGDEKIGLEIIDRLKKKCFSSYFDYFVANPRALRKKTRFIDTDLNRSYPGKSDSANYEEKLACRNLEKARRYQFIIDIHEANNGIKDFIVISRRKNSNLFPIELIDSKIILFWPSLSSSGSMGQFLKNFIELEFGMKGRNRKKVVLKAEKIVTDFIKIIYGFTKSKKSSKKKFYYVYGKIMTKDFSGDYRNLKDFRKTTINGEVFYPLLIGQYIKNGIVCYKMKLTKNS